MLVEISTLLLFSSELSVGYLRVCVLSHVWLLETTWTVAHQAPLSMRFPRQEYWRGLTFSPPGIFPTQQSNLYLLYSRWILCSHGNPTWATWEAQVTYSLWLWGCCCYVASVVSDSVRPHTWQPTRLRCPWGSPGKNTGVSCHFLLQCTKVKSESEVTQSCLTLRDPMDCSPQSSSIHGIFQARVLEWGAI